MRFYQKYQICYAIRDYFKECKGIVAVALIITFVGLTLGIASVYDIEIEHQIIKSAGKVCLRIFLLLSFCYFFILISSFNNYTLVFGLLAFLIFGYQAGTMTFFLIYEASLSKIISLCFVYLPVFCICFLLQTVAMSFSIGYMGYSPKGSFANTCHNIQKIIFRRIFCVFILNSIIILFFILIFGNIFNVICLVK